MGLDDWIPEFAAAGLDAIEVYHSKHDDKARWRAIERWRSGSTSRCQAAPIFTATTCTADSDPAASPCRAEAFDELQRRADARGNRNQPTRLTASR